MRAYDSFYPADRFIEAQSWWIASELARRHPQLVVAETAHPEVGSSLVVYDPNYVVNIQVIFNRAAGIHIPSQPDFEVTWPKVFAAVSPHDIVKEIEDALGIPVAGTAPPTTERTIVYRVIAKVLATVADDRHSWIMRGERPDDQDVLEGLDWAGNIDEFDTLEETIGRWVKDSADRTLAAQGTCRLWVLLRDLTPVVAFDLYGNAHTEGGKTHLLSAYRDSGGSMTGTIVRSLGDVLP
jgi:hypothetical protein